MRRFVLLVVAALSAGALSAGGCVVIERQTAPAPPSGEPPAGGQPVPTAEPAPLGPSSDRRLVGSLGWALASPEVPNALLEIDQLGGARLDQEAIDALVGTLREHGSKQRVEVLTTEAEAPGDRYSLDDLVNTSQDHRDRNSGGDTVALHVLVLPGRFEVEGVPGAAFHATAIALFPGEIARLLPPGAATGAFQAAVAVHELGHTFGLVNLTGVGGFHEDPERPGHTADEASVMHWAIESPSLSQVFGSGPPRTFTADDQRELDEIRRQRP
jgi:hypothetical protein